MPTYQDLCSGVSFAGIPYPAHLKSASQTNGIRESLGQVGREDMVL